MLRIRLTLLENRRQKYAKYISNKNGELFFYIDKKIYLSLLKIVLLLSVIRFRFKAPSCKSKGFYF